MIEFLILMMYFLVPFAAFVLFVMLCKRINEKIIKPLIELYNAFKDVGETH